VKDNGFIEKIKGGVYSTPPLTLREAGIHIYGHPTSLDHFCRYGRPYVFSVPSAFLVMIRRAHGVNPTLVCFLFLFHDPSSSLKLRFVILV
jgi:hypothetical protein